MLHVDIVVFILIILNVNIIANLKTLYSQLVLVKVILYRFDSVYSAVLRILIYYSNLLCLLLKL